jgi:hypothetical protein
MTLSSRLYKMIILVEEWYGGGTGAILYILSWGLSLSKTAGVATYYLGDGIYKQISYNRPPACFPIRIAESRLRKALSDTSDLAALEDCSVRRKKTARLY